ncbi:MAG: hypothetical protein JSW49_06510 [candidate division WOR-3 bacterium]|nr:MAG: hypothetical protein JSW49_06510 [candidate division WOR-3 bacterium]
MVFAIILWNGERFINTCIKNTIQEEEVMARERKGFVDPNALKNETITKAVRKEE